MAGSTQIVNGTFKNVASTPKFIAIPNQISKFQLWNLTVSGQTALGVDGLLASDRIAEGFFIPAIMSSGTGIIKQNGTVAGTIAPYENGVMAINGFTLYNSYQPLTYAPVAISSFTPGTTTVWVTGTAHGLQVGDTVRVYSLTSAPQFGGLRMTVTAVGSTTQFTTLLDSTGATTSVGFMQKVGNYLVADETGVYPENRVIAKITNANPMVVTTLVQQNYFVGDVVTFSMPTIFGIPQLTNSNSGLPFQATVIAANNAVGTQTVTLAVDSTNFGVFATNGGTSSNPGHWPLAPGYPFSFPVMVPQGEGNINNFQAFNVTPAPLPYANQDVLSFAKQNIGSRGILIGAGDGTNDASTGGIISSNEDAWYWEATTVEQTFTS